jgi:pimeloyl-ACP methyl ester carboxylesterase
MMHVPGFGLSGRYLLPTAEALMDDFHTLVPDLPGSGRSGNTAVPLDVPGLAQAAAAFLDQLEIGKVTLVGNSMGCPVICEFAHLFPGRLERAILVAPAGGLHNQPLPRAVGQILHDGIREPAQLLRVVVPDYVRFGVPSTVRLFRALTRYPTLRRLLDLKVPTLAVVGNRDPLLPPPARVREFAELEEHRTLFVVIDGAAHAINFSHPGELANVIRQFMANQSIVDDPNSRGTAKAYELYRGSNLPPTITWVLAAIIVVALFGLWQLSHHQRFQSHRRAGPRPSVRTTGRSIRQRMSLRGNEDVHHSSRERCGTEPTWAAARTAAEETYPNPCAGRFHAGYEPRAS